MPLSAIEKRAGELMLHSRINYAYRRQQEYLQADRTWGAGHAGVLRPRPVAYFSAEFGMHESLPIYSGGLGCWRAIISKALRTLDIPLIGIGLFYGQGYFRQRLDEQRLAAGRISANGNQSAGDGAGHRQERRTGERPNRHAPWLYLREGLAGQSGPHRFAAARFRCARATRRKIVS